MANSSHRTLIMLVMIPETIAVVTGLLRYRKLKRPMHLVVWLVIFGFLTDLLSRILLFYRISTLFLIAPYIAVEFGLLAAIYRYELRDSRIARLIPWLIVLMVAYSLYLIIFGKAKNFNPVERFSEGFLIITFALTYFYQTLKKLESNHLEYVPMFWLTTGLFIYFACDVIIFIFSNYILSSYSKTFNLQLWDIHAILTMVLYLFYALALWISQEKQN